MSRITKTLSLLALCAAAAACGGGGQGSSASPAFSATPEQRPELTMETLKEAINDSWVEEVPPADGQGRPEGWRFDDSEPKEITVVEQKVEGDRATFLVDMKTRTHPRARNQRVLEGRLRFTLELRSEFIFRRWDVTDVENISFKYTRLNPSPSPSPDAPPDPGQIPPPPPPQD